MKGDPYKRRPYEVGLDAASASIALRGKGADKMSAVQWLMKKYVIDGIFAKLPVIGAKVREFQRLKAIAGACGYAPGHFYSPIPSLEEIAREAEQIFSDKEPLGIELNLGEQRLLLSAFQAYRADFPYDFINAKENPVLRYRWLGGPQYRYSDVVFLCNFIRHLRPKKIIEIGSGASSAVMLDTNELFFGSSIKTTFIEPFPDRLFSFMTASDRKTSEVLATRVQNVPMEKFLELEENDILFVDSSHTVKVGSDVNHIVFEILPRLKCGVCIHFHDIFFPFELPRHWILKYKRFWNESYLLRAFLMNNDSYKMIFFNTLLQKRFRTFFEENMPECLLDEENTGSMWIMKTQ